MEPFVTNTADSTIQTDPTPKVVNIAYSDGGISLPSISSATSTGRISFPLKLSWVESCGVPGLFEPFADRSADPDSYDSKMQFWLNIVIEYCAHKGEAHFSKRELELVLGNGERIPHSLDTVMEVMERTKITRPRLEYESDPADTWTGWTALTVRRPVLWAAHKWRNIIGTACDPTGGCEEVVHVETMRKNAQELLETILLKLCGTIVSFNELLEIVEEQLPFTEDCISLCLITLQSQQKIGLAYTYIEQCRQIELIKVPTEAGATAITISANEHSVYWLKVKAAKLTKLLQEVEKQIRSAGNEIYTMMATGRTCGSRVLLCRIHLMEKIRRKRTEELLQIEAKLAELAEENTMGGIRKAVLDTMRSTVGDKFDNNLAIVDNEMVNELALLLADSDPGASMSAEEMELVDVELCLLVNKYSTATRKDDGGDGSVPTRTIGTSTDPFHTSLHSYFSSVRFCAEKKRQCQFGRLDDIAE